MDKADDGGQQKQMEEDFLAALADYTPTVPEEVTDFYLKRAGFSSILRTKLISLATQKFITDVANDALTQYKLRQQNPTQRRKDKKMVLTMEDLSSSLKEYGVNVNKPAYYATKPGVAKVQEKKKK